MLGGGFPTQSTTILSGEPGSGKTVLMLQILSHLARQGKKCLSFTTVSEPAIKLIRHMQLFSFFNPALLDDAIVIGDLGSVIRAKGFKPPWHKWRSAARDRGRRCRHRQFQGHSRFGRRNGRQWTANLRPGRATRELGGDDVSRRRVLPGGRDKSPGVCNRRWHRLPPQ